MKTRKHFKSPLALQTFSSSFSWGSGTPEPSLSPSGCKKSRISFRSRLLAAAAGLGLPRSDPVSSLHARAPGRPGLRSLSRPGSSPLENRNPRLGTGGNVRPPERQNILQIPFPEEGVESLVRFGRKAMKKRKELFETYLVSYVSLPLITKNKKIKIK